jgi:hypothetical protein
MNKYPNQDIYTTVARAFNNNDVSLIESIAADDITLTIKHEVELVSGKAEVIQYLNKKFQDKSNNDDDNLAELAHMGDQSKSRQQFTNLLAGDLCLRFAKGVLKPHGAILVLEINDDNRVTEICICTLVHDWAGVVGTGVCPK